MSITSQLSSQVGDATETANHRVAERCFQQPTVLKEIAGALSMATSPDILADAAEVMTFVAEQRPALVKPYATRLLPLLDHRKAKVRWEAAHALSLIVAEVPQVIAPRIPKLKGIAVLDDSTIVRDYATWIIVRYARTSKRAAREAVDALAIILDQWKEKQAAKVIQGLMYAVEQDSSLKAKTQRLVTPYTNSAKGIVKRAVQQFQSSNCNVFE